MTHANANYVRTSCIHDIQHTHDLKTCLNTCVVCVLYVYVAGVIDKLQPRKVDHGHLSLSLSQEIARSPF